MFSQIKRVIRVITITAALVAVVFIAIMSPAFAHDRDSLKIDPSCIGDETSTGMRLLPEDVFWLNDYLTLGEVNYGIRNGFTRGMFECYFERKAAEQPRVSQTASSRSNVVIPAEVLRWRPLVEAYFPEGWVEWALRIIDCETGHTGDPNIVNPITKASGLFQHLPKYWDERSAKAGWSGASILDPKPNVAVAWWLLKNGGTRHWTCKAPR